MNPSGGFLAKEYGQRWDSPSRTTHWMSLKFQNLICFEGFITRLAIYSGKELEAGGAGGASWTARLAEELSVESSYLHVGIE